MTLTPTHINLAALIEQTLGQPIKKSGRWLFWTCPFHPGDRTPSLGVTPHNGRWYCFACQKGGDAITWLREHHGLTYQQACQVLSIPTASLPAAGPSPAPTPTPAPHWPDDRQPAWKTIIDRCQDLLWSPIGSRARQYLHQRGLKDTTLQSPFVRAGYSPGLEIHGHWVERGIVLPCFTTTPNLDIEYIAYIKVRRPQGNPKYWKLPGGGASLSGLYGAEWILGAGIIFVTEGEFDALLLHQEAGDLVGVCTLGGAGDRLNLARYFPYIRAAEQIYITYDNDPAGQKGAAAWQARNGRVITCPVPTGKDITDFWQTGADLSTWVMQQITASNASP